MCVCVCVCVCVYSFLCISYVCIYTHVCVQVGSQSLKAVKTVKQTVEVCEG